MNLHFSASDEAFRDEVRDWLESHLIGDFAQLRGRGGPGDEHVLIDERKAWERLLADARWTCVGWPEQHGGRGLSLHREVIFHEEYARARAPGRMGHIGETLLGPTVIAFGSDEQKARILPPIRAAEALWCQGYSEPNAGSDLANVQTKAVRDGAQWVVTGQKTWTSLAHLADWCFVLCRTNSDGPGKHAGLSYLLVPMDQPGVEVRPIEQMTGTSEFSEVFFDEARASADDIVGGEGNGWQVAMGTLAFERGASTLGQQLMFRRELLEVIEVARVTGAAADPVIRQRVADLWVRLEIMRLSALRTLSSPGRQALVNKLFWATWHRELGELAMDVLGEDAERGDALPYDLSQLQRLFLFSRADTIYAGSNEIQRNIIGERGLGLPRGPR